MSDPELTPGELDALKRLSERGEPRGVEALFAALEAGESSGRPSATVTHGAGSRRRRSRRMAAAVLSAAAAVLAVALFVVAGRDSVKHTETVGSTPGTAAATVSSNGGSGVPTAPPLPCSPRVPSDLPQPLYANGVREPGGSPEVWWGDIDKPAIVGLQEELGDRFAGAWLTPYFLSDRVIYHLVVAATSVTPADRVVFAKHPWASFHVQLVTAPFSQQQLVDAQYAAQQLLGATPSSGSAASPAGRASLALTTAGHSVHEVVEVTVPHCNSAPLAALARSGARGSIVVVESSVPGPSNPPIIGPSSAPQRPTVATPGGRPTTTFRVAKSPASADLVAVYGQQAGIRGFILGSPEDLAGYVWRADLEAGGGRGPHPGVLAVWDATGTEQLGWYFTHLPRPYRGLEEQRLYGWTPTKPPPAQGGPVPG